LECLAGQVKSEQYGYDTATWRDALRNVEIDTTGVKYVDTYPPTSYDPNEHVYGSPPEPFDLPAGTPLAQYVAQTPDQYGYSQHPNQRIQVYYEGGGMLSAVKINVLQAVVQVPGDVVPVGKGPGKITVHVVPTDGVSAITAVVKGYVSTDAQAPVPAAADLTTFTADDTTGLALRGVFDITTEGTYYYTVLIADGQPNLTGQVVVGKVTVVDAPFALAITKPVPTTPPKLGEATGTATVVVTVTGGAANAVAQVAVDLTLPDSTTPATLQATSPDNRVYTAVFEHLASGLYPVRAYVINSAAATPPEATATADVQPPPLAIGDQLTFLPWVQTELAAAASGPGPSGRPELALSAKLRTRTATDAVGTLADVGPAAKAQIYGPGDVLGLNLRAILGTTPVPGARGASALELAAVAFQEEDLPWRYSTRRAGDANNTPAPWLFLLVLKADEYERPAPGAGPLPTIKVLKPGVYPSPDARQQAQWAHVQINTPLGDKPGPTATTAPAPVKADIDKFLHETLPTRPALAYARVLCPRRLEADTPYRAFVLPATEAGRLAGLGRSFAAPDAQAASVTAAAAAGAVAAHTFPVYFEWEFETGSADDFEDLAQQLHQANGSTQAAAPATLGLAGTSYALPMPALLTDLDGTLPDATPVPYPVALGLWQRLAPAFVPGLPTAVRPLVTPPLYGRAYMLSTALEAPANATGTPVLSPSWKHQVNLDPRYRALAAAGAQVVQDNQEEYVRRAWDQVQDILLANDKLRAAQYGLRTTAGLRDQHLPLLTTTTTGTTTGGGNLTAPAASFSRLASSPEEAEGAQKQPADAPAEASFTAAEATFDQAPATLDEAGASAGPGTPGTTMADYGLHLTALSLSRIRVKPATAGSTAPRPTLREAIRQSSTPLAAFSPAFRRLNNPYGKYQLAQAGRPRRATQAPPAATSDPDSLAALTTPGTSLRQRDGLFAHLTTGVIGAATPRADEVRANQFNDDAVDALLKAHDGGLPPGPATGLDETAAARFGTAFQHLRNDVPRRAAPAPNYDPDNTSALGAPILGFRKVQRARVPLDLDELKDRVITGTQPGPVFTVRVQQVAPGVPVPAVPSPGDFEAPDFNATHFYVGDFDEPAPAVPADWLDSDFSAADFNVGPYVAFDEDPAPAPTPVYAFSRQAAPAEAEDGAAQEAATSSLAEAKAGALTLNTLTTNTIIGPAPVIHTDAALPVIKQAKVFPVFKEAMGEALRQRHPELFVPGLGEFPAGGIAVLDVNQAFIEAYMVGLNHALGSELRWRGFPVEPRATFFQQFWDVRDHLNSQLDPVADAAPDATLERSALDIKPLDRWIGTALGENAAYPTAPGQRPLRLALRSELLRRYPDVVIGLQPSLLNDKQALVPDPDPTRLLLPRQRLAVGQDMLIAGFDLLLDKATAPARADGTGAYYLVLLERPGQPRFGLDAGTGTPTTTAPLGWDDLSWDYLGTQPSQNISFDFSVLPGTALTSPPSTLPHATAEPRETAYLTDSAVLAYALFQEPILLAVPVPELLA